MTFVISQFTFAIELEWLHFRLRHLVSPFVAHYNRDSRLLNRNVNGNFSMSAPNADTDSSSAILLVALAAVAMFARPSIAQEEPATAVLGLTPTRPVKARSVKTDKGYMVPYRDTIPGTKITFDMVPIPGGNVVIGSPKDEFGRGEDEGPQVQLEVKPFWMGRCEVTWAEYWVFMDCYEIFRKQRAAAPDKKEPEFENFDAVTSPTPLYDPTTNYMFGDDPKDPAVTVTQFAAKQYTKWLSLLSGEFYRLPTEAEWEYAARAGSTTAYFFGDDPEQLSKYAWFGENSNQEYHAVGSKKANPWGLHDIYGNVAELTLDPYEPDTYEQWKAGARYSGPLNWSKAKHREVVRGGSWSSGAAGLRSAARARTDPEWQDSDPDAPPSPWWFTEDQACMVGFRIIRPLRTSKRALLERQWGASGALRKELENRIDGGRAALGVVGPKLRDAIKREQDAKKADGK